MTHPTRSRRGSLTAAVTVSLVAGLLTGCGGAAPAPGDTSTGAQVSDGDDLLAAHDLAGLDTAQVIERLDTMPVADRPTDLIASVQPDAVVLTDDRDREVRLPMSEDQVYVSVAPYRDQTHDCYFHSLTTCLGELGDADVHVTLTDADGEVLIDEARTTFDNGFVGLWVPRGVEGTLRVEHEGRSGSVPIATTSDDDPTCITTLRLT